MSKIEQTRTTRSSHRTRGASKRAHCVASQELSAAIIGIVDADFELNLTNYSEAMCSVWQVVKRALGSNALHTSGYTRPRMMVMKYSGNNGAPRRLRK